MTTLPTALHVSGEASQLTAELSRSIATPSAKVATGDDARLKEAAVQFEAVFVRQMLSSLEKATSSPMGNQTSGGSIYGSMVVNSVADAIAHAGGLGLGSMLLESLEPQSSRSGMGAPTHGPEPVATGELQMPTAVKRVQPP